VLAVHAAPPASDRLDSSSYDAAVAVRERREDAIADELAGADVGDATLRVALVGGPPAEALVREARAHRAREIVVGCRGLGAIRPALCSVSREVLRRADRPVVVVPHRAAVASGGV
jgi:nucleotide-binding universal stress UspA family protein